MDKISDFAAHYLKNLREVLDRFPFAALDRIVQVLEETHAAGRQIFIIGNGGSAATAAHMMNDLNKSTLGHKGDAPWPRFRAIALADNVPSMTAWANDTSYTQIFSEQLKNLARNGDLLIALSASGNSANILAAVEAAKQIGLTTVALTGCDGGKVATMADVALIVSANEYGPIEDVHMILDHIIRRYLHEKLRQTYPQ
jgi:D-sedoheptulose 7-phosphate isomerase